MPLDEPSNTRQTSEVQRDYSRVSPSFQVVKRRPAVLADFFAQADTPRCSKHRRTRHASGRLCGSPVHNRPACRSDDHSHADSRTSEARSSTEGPETHVLRCALSCYRFGLFRPTTPVLGPCQFPTLGFVVSRYEQVKSFVPESFWFIYLSVARDPRNEEDQTEFTWRRGRLFDFDIAVALYEYVLENAMATVTKVTKKNVKKW